ncbi:endonuclease/exonuclease/phosphatase family metal-dependent hydrolase [Tamaricihabitans halophyticus]|uniref:Endonuclease/exonuclease/phosphatase family metal-dependent hydrolase n=1 Tax=Tamaricihabitans halophyticus TaxID=1262583 RepID=A0A4R2R3N7_9PSEU|nr:endonuclease/exonuclease/phosphatase family protein [Tamaricihabitans halophyticus]TCP57450.1 endonuclease/exonuclease/phosphatase family metal-dependent hydrolase [Tamaricihabitans halophyticus]
MSRIGKFALGATLTASVALTGAPGLAGATAQGPLIGPPDGEKLHVMSYNLRYASDQSPNSWDERRPAMAQLLNDERPSLIGTQEGLHDQLTDVQADLPDSYEWIGVGREGGEDGEYSAIFYDTTRLEMLSEENFWLSDTPDVPGSTSWGNELPRMVTWGKFKDTVTGTEFVAMNTHFDHKSENARLRSAELIRDRVAELDANLPVVLTGDFNANTSSEPYSILTAEDALLDSWNTAGEQLTPEYATFGGYEEPAEGDRIDWLLTDDQVAVEQVGINPFEHEGQYPSDHLPVQTLVTLN